MPELGPYGSVRGARGNSRPYRDPRPISDIRPLQRPVTCVENVGTFCARPCSIKLPKMLNQQFSKDPDLSRGVVPRWSDNEDPAFSERIAIH